MLTLPFDTGVATDSRRCASGPAATRTSSRSLASWMPPATSTGGPRTAPGAVTFGFASPCGVDCLHEGTSLRSFVYAAPANRRA